MTWDPSRQAIVLYGGAYLPDTWTYSAGTWTRLPIPDGPDPEYPFLAYDSARQKLTLFDERGETEVLESGGWRKLTPAHTPSSGGIGAMAWDSARSQIVLFGGYDQQDNPTNDVWLWDGSDWTLSTAAPGPMPQFGASLVDDGSRLLLFGLGDTWQWTGSWKSVLVGMGPPQRTNAMMAYDSARGVTVLFGGDSGSTLYGDTWEFNGAWQKK